MRRVFHSKNWIARLFLSRLQKKWCQNKCVVFTFLTFHFLIRLCKTQSQRTQKWKDINGNKFCIGKNWIRWGMQDMPVCLRLGGFFYLYRRIDGSGMSRPYHSSKCLSFWCGPNNGLVRLIFGLRATSVETIVYEFWIPTSLISTSVNDAHYSFFYTSSFAEIRLFLDNTLAAQLLFWRRFEGQINIKISIMYTTSFFLTVYLSSRLVGRTIS